MKDEGKRFSVLVLDRRFLATGRFFFSDGSSLEPSAGLLTPPTEEKCQRGEKKCQKLRVFWFLELLVSSLGGLPLK